MSWTLNQNAQRNLEERLFASDSRPRTRAPERANSNSLRADRPEAKAPQREENANPHPSILLRLKQDPTVYFLEFTDNFNRTHVAIKRSDPSSTATPGCVRLNEMTTRRLEADKKPQPRVAMLPTALRTVELTEKSRDRGKNANQHPQFLFRLERGRIVCFQGLTHDFK